MLRSVAGKVMWVGRATTFCMGLAVVLAVVFGVGTTALAAVPGDPFKLGRLNTVDRLTTLAGSVGGPLFKVDNEGSGPALALEANVGSPPLRVNAEAGKAINLDADELDGKDSADFYARGEKVADSSHADRADSATSAGDANTLDGEDASAFLGIDQKAADADELDGKDSTDFQPSNPCPSGTLFHEGVCIETAKRGPAAFPNAEAVCLQAGRRLPTVAELQTFRLREGYDFNTAEYTSHVWTDTNATGLTRNVMLVDGTGQQSVAFGSAAFRCVAAPMVATPNEAWGSAAQSDLRNAAAAATACAAANDGSYVTCGSAAQLQSYGYDQNSNVSLAITTATATRWVAMAQHNDGGSAYQFDSATGKIEPVPRF